MKRLLCVILSVILMLGTCTLPIGAEEALRDGDIFTEGDFQCKFVNGAVSIVDYLGKDGTDKAVVVPETIRGYMVKYIGSNAFGYYDYKNKFKSIQLPDTIEIIGHGAFFDIQGTVNVPDNIRYIGQYAFHRCQPVFKLSSKSTFGIFEIPEVWIIPESLEYMGYAAFQLNRATLNGSNYPNYLVSENLIFIESAIDVAADSFYRTWVCGASGTYIEEYCKDKFFFFESKYIKGDLDKNKVVDVADIMKLKTEIMQESVADYSVSDLDADENVTVGDIMALKDKIMNKKEATFAWQVSVTDTIRAVSTKYGYMTQY